MLFQTDCTHLWLTSTSDISPVMHFLWCSNVYLGNCGTNPKYHIDDRNRWGRRGSLDTITFHPSFFRCCFTSACWRGQFQSVKYTWAEEMRGSIFVQKYFPPSDGQELRGAFTITVLRLGVSVCVLMLDALEIENHTSYIKCNWSQIWKYIVSGSKYSTHTHDFRVSKHYSLHCALAKSIV